MDATGIAHVAVVVAQTEKLDQLTRTAVGRLHRKMRSVRTVEAQAERFAERMSADPARFRVEVLDVIGYCNPDPDRPGIFEPVVICDGEPMRVTASYALEAGEYSVVRATADDDAKSATIVTCARKVAANMFVCEVLMQAIDRADPECGLSSMSCDPKTHSVDLAGEDAEKVASRLPSWITVNSAVYEAARD